MGPKKAEERFLKPACYLFNNIIKMEVIRERLDKYLSQNSTEITLTKTFLWSSCIPGWSFAVLETKNQCRM